MSNTRRGCTTCVNEAWDIVTAFLLHPPESVTRRDLERLKAYVRLAWRVEQNPEYDGAGWAIQQMLDGGGDPEYDMRAEEFEEENPAIYPGHLQTIQEIIERRCRVIEPNA